MFSKKFRLNQRCGRWWMAKSCFGWPSVLWGFWVTNNHQQSFLEENHKSALWRVSFIYWCNWLHISSIWIGLYSIVCILYFISVAFRMDGSGSSWMTLPKVLPHRYKQLPKCPELKRHGIHPLHLNLMKHKHFITLKVEHNPIFHVSHSLRPRKWARLPWVWEYKRKQRKIPKKRKRRDFLTYEYTFYW